MVVRGVFEGSNQEHQPYWQDQYLTPTEPDARIVGVGCDTRLRGFAMSKSSSSAAKIGSISDEDLADRSANLVALVSGTSSGIGNACAIALLRSGYQVFGADIAPSPENLHNEPGYYHHHADLSLPEGVDDWVGAARHHSNRVDALVNCAGVRLRPAS